MRSLLAVAAASIATAAVFDLRDYGGRGDGVTLNTAAFYAAIQAAHSQWQGGPANTVLVANGTYLTGQVQLLSNVYLDIDFGATILGSANVTDYPSDESKWALVFALFQTNIGIVGAGTVDGNQRMYFGGWDDPNDKFIPQGWLPGQCQGECRPRNIRFRSCFGVVLSGVTIQNSPDWTIHMENSTNIFVDSITQYGDYRWPNNDGIDVDSSQNVTIINSSFNTGDDGVCIKSSVGFGPVRDVLVRNTTVRSRSSAIKFGSNTDVDCSNLLFEDIRVWDSNRGLGIQQRSQGNIWNVTYRNIVLETRFAPDGWWGDAEPIWVSSMPRAPGGPVGVISNVSFVNITARSENGVFLSGRSPGNTLEGITLQNVSVFIDHWSNYTQPDHDYRPTSAVSPDMGPAPVDGVYIERAAGVVLDGVGIAYNRSNPQPYWSYKCFNTTHAGYPVTQTGCSCQ